MSQFIRYPHLSKFGNKEVENIEFGITHIFPKLDGTNASVWFDERLRCGSRNRELDTVSFQNDNAGFANANVGNEKLGLYFQHNPNHILYGEWLVPHTIKNYREEAWRRFWIFDVFDRTTGKFLPYEVYQPQLEEAKLDYIPCIKKFQNGSWDNFMHEARNHAGFMLPDGGIPEGIVIKNYEWTDKHNHYTSAKIVLAEFKDKFHAAMGVNLEENVSNAQRIVNKACTQALIEKEYAKILVESGEEDFPRKLIPKLLHTVFYSVVTEELWDCLKDISYGLVNFKELQQLVFQKVKATKTELF